MLYSTLLYNCWFIVFKDGLGVLTEIEHGAVITDVWCDTGGVIMSVRLKQ